MRLAAHGPNAGVNARAFDKLALSAEEEAALRKRGRVATADAEREARSTRRAWEGAPPTVPHRVEQMALPDCLACHEHGARVAGKVAPPMLHPLRPSCVQCHVVAPHPHPESEPSASERTDAPAGGTVAR